MPKNMHFRFITALILIFLASLDYVSGAEDVTCSGIVPRQNRHENISLADFGGVGDGKTLNTKAFRDAIARIEKPGKSGGTLLYVPNGVFLTEPFNLTSHMTLYLAQGAVIKATQDIKDWPLVAPLPSYGRGRDASGPRYVGFISGYRLRDVEITGANGTIDGQGNVWWNTYKQKSLRYTRPHLVEFFNSQDIIISHITFRDSPFWNIHPVYCSNVVVNYVTILAPASSPNTDGIDPDSSTNVCIEDSYVSNGDDIVAVKSGWDEYGIAYGRPSSNIIVRRVTGSSPFAGIAVGSETSGSVENVLFEHINLQSVGYGIHIKTNSGRGGTIRNITISDVNITTVRTGIRILSDIGGHPDDKFNPDAIPVVKDITIKNIWGKKVKEAGSLKGFAKLPFSGICFSNITLHAETGKRTNWACSHVKGKAFKVTPLPCPELSSSGQLGSC